MKARETQTKPSKTLRRSDSELLEGWAVDGEETALAQLVERYSPLVLGVCRRQCRDTHDVDDAFQATFLSLARDAGRIRNGAALPGWLQRVAYRVACRARQRKLRDEPLLDDPPDPFNPLTQVARRHELRILDEELAALPERYRAVVVMHLLEGRTHAQVAHQLGTTTGVVRGCLQRGKDRLKRRLRGRGVVPGAVVIALAAWPTDTALAASLGQQFVAANIANGPELSPDGTLPDTSSLEPLLELGSHTKMSLTSVFTGISAVAVLLLVLSGTPMFNQDSDGIATTVAAAQDSDRPPATVQLPTASPAEALGQTDAAGAAAGDSPEQASEPPPAGGMGMGGGMGGMGFGMGGGMGGMMGGMGGGMGMMGMPSPPPAPARQRPTSEVAKRVFAALDTTFELPAEVSLTDLPETLMNVAEVPVLIEPRSLKMAQVEDTATLRLPAHQVPLRTSLRTALQKLNLKAVVENDGLAIVPDMGALARSNVGTTNWINVSEKVATRLLAALDDETTLEVDGTPLVEVLTQLSEQHDVPIKMDVHGLEEIGLSGDVPVYRTSVSGVTLRSALDTMLRKLDLRLTIRDEALLITTQQSAEANLLTRVYWMDATGMSNEFASLMSVAEITIDPDTWQGLGGPSAMVPLVLKERAGLTVTTTLDNHFQFENLFKVMRENHFGSDTEFSVDVPAASPEEAPQGMMGGGML